MRNFINRYIIEVCYILLGQLSAKVSNCNSFVIATEPLVFKGLRLWVSFGIIVRFLNIHAQNINFFEQYSLSAIHTHIAINEYFLAKPNAIRFDPVLLTIYSIIRRGV